MEIHTSSILQEQLLVVLSLLLVLTDITVQLGFLHEREEVEIVEEEESIMVQSMRNSKKLIQVYFQVHNINECI